MCERCPLSDPSFVKLIEREGGRFRGEKKEVVATLDDICNVTVSGYTYERTIQTQECGILCQPCSSGEKRVRCSRCSCFRAHLRVKRSRQSSSDPWSSAVLADSSYTNYSHLSKNELVEQLKNVQKSRKSIRAKHKRLAKKVIKEERSKEDGDARVLMDDVTSEIRMQYDTDSLQYVLWQEQKKYNLLKNKCQMRWHPLVIRFALSLFYSSRVAYRTATSSGFLALPSERTLMDYTHWCSVYSSCAVWVHWTGEESIASARCEWRGETVHLVIRRDEGEGWTSVSEEHGTTCWILRSWWNKSWDRSTVLIPLWRRCWRSSPSTG